MIRSRHQRQVRKWRRKERSRQWRRNGGWRRTGRRRSRQQRFFIFVVCSLSSLFIKKKKKKKKRTLFLLWNALLIPEDFPPSSREPLDTASLWLSLFSPNQLMSWHFLLFLFFCNISKVCLHRLSARRRHGYCYTYDHIFTLAVSLKTWIWTLMSRLFFCPSAASVHKISALAFTESNPRVSPISMFVDMTRINWWNWDESALSWRSECMLPS